MRNHKRSALAIFGDQLNFAKRNDSTLAVLYFQETSWIQTHHRTAGQNLQLLLFQYQF